MAEWSMAVVLKNRVFAAHEDVGPRPGSPTRCPHVSLESGKSVLDDGASDDAGRPCPDAPDARGPDGPRAASLVVLDDDPLRAAGGIGRAVERRKTISAACRGVGINRDTHYDWPTKKTHVRRTRTAANKVAFLEQFKASGTISAACRGAGINRDTHYDWLAKDPQYAKTSKRRNTSGSSC
jgi:transposase-like protein